MTGEEHLRRMILHLDIEAGISHGRIRVVEHGCLRLEVLGSKRLRVMHLEGVEVAKMRVHLVQLR